MTGAASAVQGLRPERRELSVFDWLVLAGAATNLVVVALLLVYWAWH